MIFQFIVVILINIHMNQKMRKKYHEWTGENADVQISEAGRKLLSGLLQQLTDDDLVNLFVPARLYLKPETMNIAGQDNAVTILDWIRAFKDKVAEISEHSCPAR